MGNKRVHVFLKSKSLKVNVIARLELELTYMEAEAQRFIHYATWTPTAPPKYDEYIYESELLILQKQFFYFSILRFLLF